jgi:putative NADPH-quinone reductase
MNTPGALKGFFDRTLIPHQCWHFPKEETGIKSYLPVGLAPGLLNIKQVYGISTYGCTRPIATLTGDNGRRMISTAILPIFSNDCTIRWHGLYSMDFQTDENRRIFLDEVKAMVKEV